MMLYVYNVYDYQATDM